jgi:hypothetical protein
MRSKGFSFIEFLVMFAIVLFIIAIALPAILGDSPKHKPAPRGETFQAVGYVTKASAGTLDGTTYVTFTHGNGQMERMVFCKSGGAEILQGMTATDMIVVTYSGIPGVGCYKVENVSRVK